MGPTSIILVIAVPLVAAVSILYFLASPLLALTMGIILSWGGWWVKNLIGGDE
jgi:hypothetical protein